MSQRLQTTRLTTTNRIFFAGLVIAFLPSIPLAGQEADTDWSSRAIRLPASERSETPPIPTCLALHPKADTLAVAGDDHTIHVWDMTSKQFIVTLHGHEGWIRDIAYSPGGKRLASAGNDRRLILWDALSNHQQEQAIEFDKPISAFAFNPDGNRLAVIGFNNVMQVIDVRTGITIRKLQCPCVDMRALAWSPDGQTLAAAGRNGIVKHWEATTGRVVRETTPHRLRIRDLAFSDRGSYFVSASEDRSIHAEQLETQQSFYLPAGSAKVLTMAFCGSARLATGGSDDVVRIWDLHSRREVSQLRGHTGSVASLACGRDAIVSASYDATFRIWRRNGNAATNAVRDDRSSDLRELDLN